MGDSPIAVGTTTMDAIMAFVVGHSESSNGDIHEVEIDLRRIQTFLLDRDDGAEAQRRAANMLFTQRREDGKKYFLSDPEDNTAPSPLAVPAKPAGPKKTYKPDDDEIASVASMNEQQRRSTPHRASCGSVSGNY